MFDKEELVMLTKAQLKHENSLNKHSYSALFQVYTHNYIRSLTLTMSFWRMR